MMAPPVTTPANPEGMNGCQFAGRTSMPPTIRKITIAVSLTATMMLLVSADSRTPRTSKMVRTKTTRNAGTLKYAPVNFPEAYTALDQWSGKMMPKAAS